MLVLVACTSADSVGDSPAHDTVDSVADTGDTAPPAFGRVSAEGADLVRGGEPFRFIGFNTRGLPHYGGGDLLPLSSEADITLTLDAAQALGGTVVRVFAANELADADTASARLAVVLDLAEARQLYVIVVLTDAFATGFTVAGDEGFYLAGSGGPAQLSAEWYATGHEEAYLPFVETLVAANAGHPALLAWELANEPHNPGGAEALLTWAADTSDRIRALDPATMVSAGLAGTAQAGLDSSTFLAMGPNIDFMTIHTFEGEVSSDLGLSIELGVPIVQEVAGVSGTGRGSAITWAAESVIAGGADGFMQWGLMATTTDIGDGDTEVGMDRVFHDDWAELEEAYLVLAGRL